MFNNMSNMAGSDGGNISDKELIKRQESVIAAFASDFHTILFVDLDTNGIEVYQTNGDNDDWVFETAKLGFEEYKKRFSEKYIPLVERDQFMSDFSTKSITNKLEDDPIFYVDHNLLKRGKVFRYQTKVVLDPVCTSGNRILIGSHRTYN